MMCSGKSRVQRWMPFRKRQVALCVSDLRHTRATRAIAITSHSQLNMVRRGYKNALDYLCNSSGAVASGLGWVSRARSLHPHRALPGSDRASHSALLGTAAGCLGLLQLGRRFPVNRTPVHPALQKARRRAQASGQGAQVSPGFRTGGPSSPPLPAAWPYWYGRRKESRGSRDNWP